MMTVNTDNVTSAFEILLESIETEVDFLTRYGIRAFEEKDFEKVDLARTEAEKITLFHEKVAVLQKEWKGMTEVEVIEVDEETNAERRNLGRLQRGLRTTEEDFRLPVLQALVEAGGRAKTRAALDRVGEIMKGTSNEFDHEPLASGSNTMRWRNTAQWARNSMCREGLMKADSPHGVWEISDEGRRYLKEQSK